MDYVKIGAQYKVAVGSVEKEYNRIKTELSGRGLVGDELETTTIELVHLHLRSQGKSKADLFFGVVVGYDYVRDMAALKDKKTQLTKRDAAVEAARTDLTAAISGGKVAVLKDNTRTMLNPKTSVVETTTFTADNWKDYVVDVAGISVVPLDSMKKFPGTNSDNTGYLKPLPVNQWTTEIEGILKNVDGTFKRFVLNYRQPKHPGIIPTGVAVEFKAIKKEEKDGVLKLNSSVYTDFVPSPTGIGADIATLVGVGYGSLKLMTSNLPAYYEAHKDNPYDTLVLLEGYVSDTRLDVTVPYMLFDDFSKDQNDPNQKIILHQGIPLNFAVGSKVVVLGRVKQSNYNPQTKKQEDGYAGAIEINAMGVHVKADPRPKVDNVDVVV